MVGQALVRALEPEWRPVLDVVARARGWPSSADVGKLAARVAELSDLYNDSRRARASIGDAGPARLGFSFARDVPKGAGAVRELIATGGFASEGTLKVLDLGAGLGAMTWGLVRALQAAGSRLLVDAVWVDSDVRATELAADIARERWRERVPEFQLRTIHADLRGASSWGQFDVIFLGNVLSELSVDRPPEARVADHVTLVRSLLDGNLRTGGALVIVEPALRTRTRHLHAVRDALCRQQVRVVAPCLHQSDCPARQLDSEWCHESLAVDLPDWLVPVARAAGLRFERLTFSYLVLGKGRPTLSELVVAPPGAGRLRVVSDLIVSKGKREAFMCGEFASSNVQADVVAARARVTSLTRYDRLAKAESSARGSGFNLMHGDLVVIDPAPLANAPRLSPRARLKILGRDVD